jgi:hypothetical protein
LFVYYACFVQFEFYILRIIVMLWNYDSYKHVSLGFCVTKM